METIICNTGPLIALAGIRRLDILKNLYTTIIVPIAVHQELLNGGKFLTGLDEYRKADWLRKTELKQPGDPLLSTVLDEGESSVIHLALELGISNILMDERKGRRIAREIYGMKVTGTARIFVEAKKANLINSVKENLQEVCDNGYWIHDKIIQKTLKEAGET